MPLVSDAKFTNLKIENMTGSTILTINDEPLITAIGDGQFKLNISNISSPSSSLQMSKMSDMTAKHASIQQSNIDPSQASASLMPKGVTLINPLQKKNLKF